MEEEPRERGSLDLDVLGAGLAALLEQDHEQPDEADPEADRQDLTQRAIVELEPGVEQQNGEPSDDDRDRHRIPAVPRHLPNLHVGSPAGRAAGLVFWPHRREPDPTEPMRKVPGATGHWSLGCGTSAAPCAAGHPGRDTTTAGPKARCRRCARDRSATDPITGHPIT